jgi:hypothetical protein
LSLISLLFIHRYQHVPIAEAFAREDSPERVFEPNAAGTLIGSSNTVRSADQPHSKEVPHLAQGFPGESKAGLSIAGGTRRIIESAKSANHDLR